MFNVKEKFNYFKFFSQILNMSWEKNVIFIFFILTLYFPLVSSQLNVGISPGFIDVGEIERGSTKIVSFYIVSNSYKDLIVSMNALKDNEEFIKRIGYDKIQNYSEEDASGWIEFINNPVVIKLNETSVPGKSTIKGWKEVNFIIKVPKDAEPGYHTLQIFFNPRTLPEYEGNPIIIKATIPLKVVFNIAGPAIRQGKILDIKFGNYVNNKLEVNVFFQNTGTVSMTAHCDMVRIFKGNQEIFTTPSNYDFVGPNEIKTFKAYWDVKGIDFGNYEILANVSYKTGTASKKTTVAYREPIPTAYALEQYKFPWLWVIIVILVVVVIVYIFYRWYSE
jgi:hypothetical protein